jgi:hypothetical protein
VRESAPAAWAKAPPEDTFIGAAPAPAWVKGDCADTFVSEKAQPAWAQEFADTLRDALNIRPGAANDAFEDKEGGGQTIWRISEKVLRLPAAGDRSSAIGRAEAIRAHLEAEIGVDKMIAVTEAIEGGRAPVPDVDPALVGLAQHLVMLEETIQASAR